MAQLAPHLSNLSGVDQLEPFVSAIEQGVAAGRMDPGRLEKIFRAGLASLAEECRSTGTTSGEWHVAETAQAIKALALCHIGAAAGQGHDVVHSLLFPAIYRYAHGGPFRGGALDSALSLEVVEKVLSKGRDLTQFDRGVLLHQKGLDQKGRDLQGAEKTFEMAATELRGFDTNFEISALRQRALCALELGNVEGARAAAEAALAVLDAGTAPAKGFSNFAGYDEGLAFMAEKALPALLCTVYGRLMNESGDVEAWREKFEGAMARSTLPFAKKLELLPGLQLAELLPAERIVKEAGGIEAAIDQAEQALAAVQRYPGGDKDLMHTHLTVAVVATKLLTVAPPELAATLERNAAEHLDAGEALAQQCGITDGIVPRVIRALKDASLH